jgi:large subunit ribosomal protein L29
VPILRLKDIRGMSSEERTKRLSDLTAELTRLKTMVRAGGAVENPTRIRELRKTIAKILTIENEDRLGLRKEGKAPEKTAKRKSKKEKKTK